MPTVEQAQSVFRPIADRYAIANRVISAGFDSVWRRSLVRRCLKDQPQRVLDVACGTGEVLFELRCGLPHAALLVGVDVTESMLRLAQKRGNHGQGATPYFLADGVSLPFQNNSFDAITISFGLRNLPSLELFFKEALRVLQPHGKLWVLEFSTPRPSWFRQLYFLYFSHWMPRLGAWITGAPESYRYLAQTVKVFPDQETLKKEMEEIGFKHVNYINFWRGVTAIHTGIKG